MNKAELVSEIAVRSGLTKGDAKKALDATIDAIKDAVKKDDKVSLIGFGTFSQVKRAARQGINPRTKEKIEIAAKNVFKFKASTSI